ncbi:MAG TPA: RDD family protein [Candidatus Limnocylindria bacterium]|nr:RDD family protein [Candidatus Limnocylindria bacterium]
MARYAAVSHANDRDPGPAARTFVARPGSAQAPAGLLRRLTAYLADAVLLTALIYVASFTLGLVRGPIVRFQPLADTGGALITVDPAGALLAGVASLALGALYFIGSWTRSSATLGQRLLGVRVGAARDQRTLSFGQAAVRWLLLLGPLSLGALGATAMPGLRPAFGPILLVWYAILLITTMRSPMRQGLHDRLAGSVVTRPDRVMPPVAS